MVGRNAYLEAPRELLDNQADPDARAVLEDFRLSNGEKVTRLASALWIVYSDRPADDADAAAADDAADADADADDAAAAADDDASTSRNINAILNGDIDVRNGLKIIQIPGRYYYAVTRVGWLRRIAGDEYELVGAVTIVRTSGERRIDELASDGPKKDHRVAPAAKVPEEVHRFGIRRCMPADEAAWAEHCPKPKGWKVEG